MSWWGKAAQTVVGGGGGGTGLMGPGLGMISQNQANISNARQASIGRTFADRMSSTAHQREADDLEAAGLNRILSISGGASSPSASVPVMKSIGESAASSAQGAVRLKADLAKIKAATDLDKAALPGVEGNSMVSQVGAATAVRRLKSEFEFEKKYPGRLGAIDAIMRRLGVGATNRGVSIRSGGKN